MNSTNSFIGSASRLPHTRDVFPPNNLQPTRAPPSLSSHRVQTSEMVPSTVSSTSRRTRVCAHFQPGGGRANTPEHGWLPPPWRVEQVPSFYLFCRQPNDQYKRCPSHSTHSLRPHSPPSPQKKRTQKI